MKNYTIDEIKGPNISYPKAETQQFLQLAEYLNLAKRAILMHAPRGNIKKDMLVSEDAISLIAHKIMVADWKFQEGKGSRTHLRNLYGKYAVNDFMTSSYKKKNSMYRVIQSEDENSIYDLVPDKFALDPALTAKNNERKKRVKDRIEFAINNCNLSKVQRDCVEKRFFLNKEDGSQYSYAEIGKMFDPKISRQAVQQNIERSLSQIKSVLTNDH